MALFPCKPQSAFRESFQSFILPVGLHESLFRMTGDIQQMTDLVGQNAAQNHGSIREVRVFEFHGPVIIRYGDRVELAGNQRVSDTCGSSAGPFSHHLVNDADLQIEGSERQAANEIR